ncbi:hypothetical protein BKI52_20010 [marine bacterium AO1-C]|nr:hypothetical protein BKI52_20010 [marine bacterium AO1-C]
MKNLLILFIFLCLGHITLAQQPVTIHTLTGHQYPITHVKLDKEGKQIISADKSGTIKVWDTSTGKCQQTLQGFKKPILDIDIREGTVAASSLDKTVKIWNGESGQLKFSRKMGFVTNIILLGSQKFLINKNTTKLNLPGLLIGQVNTNQRETAEVWFTSGKKYASRLKSPNISKAIAGRFHSLITISNDQLSVTYRPMLFRNFNKFRLKFTSKILTTEFIPGDNNFVVALSNGALKFVNDGTEEIYKIIQLKQSAKQVRFSQSVSFDTRGFYDRYFAVLGTNNTLYTCDHEKRKVLNSSTTTYPIQDFLVLDNTIKTVELDAASNILFFKRYEGLFTLSPQVRIRRYVEKTLKEWQQKGKFEKSADYVKRVTEANRQKQLKTLTQKAINSLAQKDLNWKNSKNEYDADNETFKINIDNTYTFYLKVPLKEAKEFDSNFKNTRYENAQFTLDAQGRFRLLHVELKGIYSSKKYIYDNTQQVAFNSNQLAIKLDPIKIKIPTKPVQKPSENNPKTTQNVVSTAPKIAEVDLNLPKTNMQNRDAIAVVIGNRNYLKTKEVQFAINDARSIKKYLVEVLGFQPGNIYYQENATKGDFEILFGNQSNYQGKLYNTVKAGKSDVFIFYSGHGAPDTKNFKGYFVPVECDPQYVSLAGYPIDLFYRNLAKLPAKSVTVVLDACFSGAEILKNISPIGVKSKGIKGIKNGVLLASSQGTQVSSWYNAKRHGLFTYFFLKAIHNKNADANKDNQLTFKEIYQYIANQTEGVPYWARRLHNVEQMPALKGKNQTKVLVKY